MDTNEPTLTSIEDYDSLKGQKRRVVWAVILSGLIIGSIFLAAKIYYGTPEDQLHIDDSIASIPVK